ncbi:uncharacterized protein [Parasteatoda tepidariorum]|uniref:uncharacterized protein n=1 Tax=Parasteatoda tepidariorum TaxID=114398 RepID=UPI0039BC8FC9
MSTQCSNKFSCKKCRGKHHDSICFKSDLNDKEEEKESKTLEVSQNSSSKFGSNIVLQNVNAIAEGPQNHFLKNLELFEEYKEVIQRQLKKKIIEKIGDDSKSSDVIYYIPHHAVIRPEHTTTKLRFVYDASSKEKEELSLNDCLLDGPNFLPDLLKILLNFRKYRVVMTSDIEKTNFWSQASPFLLAACIKHHLKKFQDIYPKTVQLLGNSFYVDDFITGVDSEHEARQVYHEAKTIMDEASMNSTKWNTNSEELQEEFFPENGIDWDQPVPEEIKANWNCWYNQLQGLCEVNIPRWYFLSRETPQSLEIHVFCDSSQTAYGTVIYLRFTVSSEIRTAFVLAKGKVAPLKKMTLPRLELKAAVIGVRLLKVLQEQFPDAKACLWTDSSIVLNWIRGSAYCWKTFVKNRVSEVKESTSAEMWYHCPGSDNPADKITRGVKIKDLVCGPIVLLGYPNQKKTGLIKILLKLHYFLVMKKDVM